MKPLARVWLCPTISSTSSQRWLIATFGLRTNLFRNLSPNRCYCTFTSRMQSNRNTSAHFLDFLAVLLLAIAETSHHRHHRLIVPFFKLNNLLLNFAQIVEFVKIVRWISPSCYMDTSKLIHGVSLCGYMVCKKSFKDFSKLLWVICDCWGNSSMVEGRFSKWF